MADARALSQWEVDALLNQIPEGEAGAEGGVMPAMLARDGEALSRAVKSYDFRRPDKFSKEQWTTLQSMHESFARQIGAAFSQRLRSLVTVRLSSIEQGLYEEWQSQVPTQTTCYVIGMQPLSGSIVVEFNQDVAAEVVDRLLGGSGTLLDRTREVTEIEMQLLRSYSRTVTGVLSDVWRNVVPVEPALQDLVMDASILQVAGDNDVVVTAFFEVNLGSHLGAMSICTPFSVIEPVVSQLSAQVWRNSIRKQHVDASIRRLVEASLRRTKLELSVELGTATMPAGEIMELAEGDTLVLDALAERPISATIGGEARFLCRPGMVGRRVAISITEALPFDGGERFANLDEQAADMAVSPTEAVPGTPDVPAPLSAGEVPAINVEAPAAPEPHTATTTIVTNPNGGPQPAPAAAAIHAAEEDPGV